MNIRTKSFAGNIKIKRSLFTEILKYVGISQNIISALFLFLYNSKAPLCRARVVSSKFDFFFLEYVNSQLVSVI